jgi:capsular exopolysaccharide synthesis family protein
MMIVLASVAAALAVAILLDKTDRRFRYPDQVTRDMGLTILGVVPKIRNIRRSQSNADVAAGVTEAFRTLRLALAHAFQAGEPIMLTVSSPGVGDGKSLIAGNLALALADGGYRTLLIDGDTRRGELHADFGLERRPGLLDHLAGKAALESVVQKTSHDNLWMIPGGTRFRHGPELLMTQAAKPMLAELKSNFDAVIIDSPPLGAGVDAFVLSSAVNNLLLVLRSGKSDRKLAEAKLDLMDRLPVRVLGAVLNGVNGAREYEHYKYIDGYVAGPEEEDTPYITAGTSSATGVLVAPKRP